MPSRYEHRAVRSLAGRPLRIYATARRRIRGSGSRRSPALASHDDLAGLPFEILSVRPAARRRTAPAGGSSISESDDRRVSLSHTPRRATCSDSSARGRPTSSHYATDAPPPSEIDAPSGGNPSTTAAAVTSLRRPSAGRAVRNHERGHIRASTAPAHPHSPRGRPKRGPVPVVHRRPATMPRSTSGRAEAPNSPSLERRLLQHRCGRGPDRAEMTQHRIDAQTDNIPVPASRRTARIGRRPASGLRP